MAGISLPPLLPPVFPVRDWGAQAPTSGAPGSGSVPAATVCRGSRCTERAGPTPASLWEGGVGGQGPPWHHPGGFGGRGGTPSRGTAGSGAVPMGKWGWGAEPNLPGTPTVTRTPPNPPPPAVLDVAEQHLPQKQPFWGHEGGCPQAWGPSSSPNTCPPCSAHRVPPPHHDPRLHPAPPPRQPCPPHPPGQIPAFFGHRKMLLFHPGCAVPMATGGPGSTSWVTMATRKAPSRSAPTSCVSPLSPRGAPKPPGGTLGCWGGGCAPHPSRGWQGTTGDHHHHHPPPPPPAAPSMGGGV